LLREYLSGGTLFPLRLTLRAPTSADISDRFDAVRAWATALATMSEVHVIWRDVRHRVQGMQRVPESLWVDTVDDAVSLLEKAPDCAAFVEVIALTDAHMPELRPWLSRRPLVAAQLASDWQRLLTVVSWIVAHPRSGRYIRQISLPGIHSKFIESHRGVLSELLDQVLPADAIDMTRSGIAHFSARYGFAQKPTRIRFRELDPRRSLLPGLAGADIALDAESFSKLNADVKRVFITENETSFLTFPSVPDGIVIFGSGYGWDALAKADWLNRCAIYYWGDIDTHGFAILNQLRRHFRAVTSILMDRTTFDTHADSWGSEASPVMTDLPGLTAEEGSLYNDLRYRRLQPDVFLRLEQEYVDYAVVEAALRRIIIS
jgi:hypothetical protein